MKSRVKGACALLTVAFVASSASAIKDAKIPNPPANFTINGASADKGASLFKTNCVLCHGAKGKGDGIGATPTARPPDFTSKAEMQPRSDYRLYYVIKEGGDKAKLSPMMLAYGSFSDTQLKDLVAFIRTLAKK